jgi:hypothetical protein
VRLWVQSWDVRRGGISQVVISFVTLIVSLAVSQWVWIEALGLFVVFSQEKPHLAIFITPL